jgi:hypothetical protein
MIHQSLHGQIDPKMAKEEGSAADAAAINLTGTEEDTGDGATAVQNAQNHVNETAAVFAAQQRKRIPSISVPRELHFTSASQQICLLLLCAYQRGKPHSQLSLSSLTRLMVVCCKFFT